MPPILFPASSAPGKDEVEGSGRLINAYSEKLQDGAPAQYVIRRAPGLVSFCETSESDFAGLWYDGQAYLYAAWAGGLYYIDSTGAETFIDELFPSSVLTAIDTFTDTANQTTYTFEDVDIGSAHSARRIVVAVLFDDDDYYPASVTVGGVGATLVKAQGHGGVAPAANRYVAIYIAHVPTGATADIVVEYATSTLRGAIGVWRLDGLTSDTPYDTRGAPDSGGSAITLIGAPANGAVIAAAVTGASLTWNDDSVFYDAVDQDFTTGSIEGQIILYGASKVTTDAATIMASASTGGVSAVTLAAASWESQSSSGSGNITTFAKNNRAPTPDQVLCSPAIGAATFDTSGITSIDVNGELPNSVTFGEGFFFFTTPEGLCYASGINDTTVNSLDVIRVEARAEALVRGIYINGELYLFGLTHTEVWASNGNPNSTGFPLNRTTVIWRGLIAPLAVCGFEEGFEGGLFFVADDNSVRLLSGYQPQTISTPDVERAIEACTNKTAIRCFVYDLDGHACVVVDIAGEATWVYDLTEGGRWHERKSDDADAWKLTGNSVKAFGKWIAGDRTSGNLYQIDPTTFDEDGDTLSFVAESIAMEAFPQRLQVPRADFNFGMGVGTDDVDEPQVKIQWSDDGGHTWSDPLTASLGEKGRRKMQVRKNRLGLTGVKGRRFRLTVDDPVYVALLAGSMEVEARR